MHIRQSQIDIRFQIVNQKMIKGLAYLFISFIQNQYYYDRLKLF
jgi:hypothetical protein